VSAVAEPVSLVPAGPLTSEVVVGAEPLEALWRPWDELAVAAGRPYGAPGWVLPWWRHCRAPRSTLRTVVVRDRGELIGVVPVAVRRDRAGVVRGVLAGQPTAAAPPVLARPDRAGDVARATAAALAGSGIDLLTLPGVPATDASAGLLAAAWPRRVPRLDPVESMPVPVVVVPPGGHEEWLAGRSPRMRRQIRQSRRRFDAEGGRFGRARTPAEVRAGLAALERMHAARWASRGGSQALGAPVLAMLHDAAARLGPDRLVVWTAEIDGRPIAASVSVVAGDVSEGWLNAFDEAWAVLSPSLLLLTEVVRRSIADGARHVSLGPGGHAYKQRVATGEERWDWLELVPRGPRYAYVQAVRSPQLLRRELRRRLTPEQRARLAALARRSTPGDGPGKDAGDAGLVQVLPAPGDAPATIPTATTPAATTPAASRG
jgi:CelD/BcsL family acetyltransferase involved in cellulose biosynthesis